MKRFVDETVIITGASSGIGAASARCFAKDGANVVLVARTGSALKAVAAQIDSSLVLVVTADLADTSAPQVILGKACERFGHIHVLVNNAAFHARGDLEHVNPDDLARRWTWT